LHAGQGAAAGFGYRLTAFHRRQFASSSAISLFLIDMASSRRLAFHPFGDQADEEAMAEPQP
jgi:hypothetical protein